MCLCLQVVCSGPDAVIGPFHHSWERCSALLHFLVPVVFDALGERWGGRAIAMGQVQRKMKRLQEYTMKRCVLQALQVTSQ